MNLNLSREWYLQRAEAETCFDFRAGRPFGLPIVINEAVPPDTLVFVPQLKPLPGESEAEYLARVAAGSMKVRFGDGE